MGEMTGEARHAANFLASMPSGNTTLLTADYRSLQMETGSQLMARGELYNIVGKSLGAGVFFVSLKLWSPS